MGPLEYLTADEVATVRSLRQSYMAVDHDNPPPDWFDGIVERRRTGTRERWKHGRCLVKGTPR